MTHPKSGEIGQLYLLVGRALSSNAARRACERTGFAPEYFTAEILERISSNYFASAGKPYTYVRTAVMNYLRSYFARQGYYGRGGRAPLVATRNLDDLEVAINRRLPEHREPRIPAERVWQSLGMLPDHLREAIEAFAQIHPQHLNCHQVATKYGRSRQQVYNWVREARSRLREQLREELI